MKRFQSKVAIVTGGARGIGAATVERLALEGCAVVVADVLEAEGRALVDLLRKRELNTAFLEFDVTSEAGWSSAVTDTIRLFGGLDVLINNASVARAEDVEQETLKGWHKVIEVNQTGVFLGMRAVLPALQRAGRGAIVNVSSICGQGGGDGTAAAFHASQGAVRLITKNAAVRFAAGKIRVNSVHPGFVETPMPEPLLEAGGEAARNFQRYVEERTPMRRRGAPSEIASAIAFLASDDASYVTGAELYVDGGCTAW